MLSTYRWTWPWSGRMAVVVAVTISAPFSLSTTWTDVSVTVVPEAGCTISTVAGEDGRGPGAVGPGVGAGVPAWEQAARRAAAARPIRTRRGREPVMA